MNFVLLGPATHHDLLRQLVRRVGLLSRESYDARVATLSDMNEGETAIMAVTTVDELYNAKHLAERGFDGHDALVVTSSKKLLDRMPKKVPDNVQILACTMSLFNLDVVAPLFQTLIKKRQLSKQAA